MMQIQGTASGGGGNGEPIQSLLKINLYFEKSCMLLTSKEKVKNHVKFQDDYMNSAWNLSISG